MKMSHFRMFFATTCFFFLTKYIIKLFDLDFTYLVKQNRELFYSLTLPLKQYLFKSFI